MIDVVHLRGVARAAVLDVGDEGVPVPAVDRPARKPHANLSRATHGPNMQRQVVVWSVPMVARLSGGSKRPAVRRKWVGRRKGCGLLRSPAGVEE